MDAFGQKICFSLYPTATIQGYNDSPGNLSAQVSRRVSFCQVCWCISATGICPPGPCAGSRWTQLSWACPDVACPELRSLPKGSCWGEEHLPCNLPCCCRLGNYRELVRGWGMACDRMAQLNHVKRFYPMQ